MQKERLCSNFPLGFAANEAINRQAKASFPLRSFEGKYDYVLILNKIKK